MNLPDELEASILSWNNAPIEDFLGLSSIEIHHLLYETYGNKSRVQLRDDIDDQTLDKIPLFRIVENYLKIIHRDKHIKLTPLGALPKKVLVEVYSKRYLLEKHFESGINKHWREDNFIAIKSARLTAGIAGLVKKANGKLTLTKKATKILEANKRSQLFRHFFQTFTNKFLWGYNDGYPQQPIGQLGWAFSVILLDKYGNLPQTVDFFAEKYLRAFPKFITFFQPEYSTPEQQFLRCFKVRTFDRFFIWFGFVAVDGQNKISDLGIEKFMQTELVKRIFKIDW